MPHQAPRHPARPFAAPLLALALALAPGAARAAAEPFDFYAHGPYRANVPRPAAVLGYAPGTFHTAYGHMERYVDALLAAAPDRVRRETFGRTYEFRERAVLVVTAPANHARLEAIRAATAALADPRPGRGAAAVPADLPVTVWLNYSIHGDESASFEAMMQVAYQLAAGEDARTRTILERCVVLLNVAHNPDGHERFVTWINALGRGDPDPLAIEQQGEQPWAIGGRTNHYQIDLNRDALAMSQVESRQLARAFRRWRPQVFVDHHGQTASYFFAPPAAPINPSLPGEEVRRWTEVFGRANAEAFDRHGWSYYVRDVFDLHYPGYMDSWPALQGAIGMTYETDGGGNLAIRRDDETVVTLLDGIERHVTASLATCAAAAEHRAARLEDFARFAAEAIEEGRRGPVRAFAWEAGDDPVRAAALAENLLHAGVEVRWVAGAFRAASAQPVWSDAGAARTRDWSGSAAPPPPRASARAFPAGVFVVDLAQPASRLARTLLERDAPVDSAFARAQLAKYERNLRRGRNEPTEPYDFYDVTAWSLAVSYAVPVWALGDAPPSGVALAPPDPDAPDPADDTLADSAAVGIPVPARTSRVGPLVLRGADGAVALDLGGGVSGGEARTAYVWSCATDGAARLALRLLQEGFKVATATRPLRAGGTDLPRGSFIARVERNPATLHARVAALARSSGVHALAVHSAWTETGDTGIGSESVVSLKAPRIAVLVDRPVPPTAYGALWFLFERRLGVRFTALRAAALAHADLERFDVVLVPGGGGGALAAALGDGGIERLHHWVERGGTLVLQDGATELATRPAAALSSVRLVGVPAASAKEEDDDAPPDSAKAEAARRPQDVPGTVFWATLDPHHFLAWGQRAGRVPVLLDGRRFLRPSRHGANPARFDRRPLKLSGWTWPETERRLEGTAYAVDEPLGDGHVVLLNGQPAFRLCWRGTERFLLNAVLYAPAL